MQLVFFKRSFLQLRWGPQIDRKESRAKVEVIVGSNGRSRRWFQDIWGVESIGHGYRCWGDRRCSGSGQSKCYCCLLKQGLWEENWRNVVSSALKMLNLELHQFVDANQSYSGWIILFRMKLQWETRSPKKLAQSHNKGQRGSRALVWYSVLGAKGVVDCVNVAETSGQMRPHCMSSGFSTGKP